MNLLWTEIAWEDYIYWQSQDKKNLRRINGLIKEIQRTPFIGTGKPEPLRHEFQGCWSRRIDDKNRIVYSCEGDTVTVFQCRTHYGNK